MFRKIILAITLALVPALSQADTVAQLQSQLQAESTAYENLAVVWQELQVQFGQYAGELNTLSDQEYSGPGEQVPVPVDGKIEPGNPLYLCPNPLWRAVTYPIDVSAMNLAGDAYETAYAMEADAINWANTVDNLIVAQEQAGDSTSTQLMTVGSQEVNGIVPLLKNVGNTLQSATSLTPLPFTSWEAGQGQVIELSGVTSQVTPGWNCSDMPKLLPGVDVYCVQGNGAPTPEWIGGAPDTPDAQVTDPAGFGCPTATASLPTITDVVPVLEDNAGAAESFGMSPLGQAEYTIPGDPSTTSGYGASPNAPAFSMRESANRILAQNAAEIANLMAEITPYSNNLSTIMKEIN